MVKDKKYIKKIFKNIYQYFNYLIYNIIKKV